MQDASVNHASQLSVADGQCVLHPGVADILVGYGEGVPEGGRVRRREGSGSADGPFLVYERVGVDEREGVVGVAHIPYSQFASRACPLVLVHALPVRVRSLNLPCGVPRTIGGGDEFQVTQLCGRGAEPASIIIDVSAFLVDDFAVILRAGYLPQLGGLVLVHSGGHQRGILAHVLDGTLAVAELDDVPRLRLVRAEHGQREFRYGYEEQGVVDIVL